VQLLQPALVACAVTAVTVVRTILARVVLADTDSRKGVMEECMLQLAVPWTLLSVAADAVNAAAADATTFAVRTG
jgi:hypothetical protein